MRRRGWTKRTFISYTSQIPFSFYGREGPRDSPVHVAIFFWCRAPRGLMLFRNCRQTGHHGSFPELAAKRNTSMWRMSMHTTRKVLFPRQKMPWHRTWIWAPHDLKGYFNQIISPFAMEGNLTKGNRYHDMMTTAVIMSFGHHSMNWERKEMKTNISNIAYLKNYDPTDFENTLPFPTYDNVGLRRTRYPTDTPTTALWPTGEPTRKPTRSPTKYPTRRPTKEPTKFPTAYTDGDPGSRRSGGRRWSRSKRGG